VLGKFARLAVLLLLGACGAPPPPQVVVAAPVDQRLAVGACQPRGAWWACVVTNKTAAKLDLGDITHSSYDGMGVRIDHGLIVGQIDANGQGEFILGGPTNADIAKIVIHQ
jgi:hypothetical protein